MCICFALDFNSSLKSLKCLRSVREAYHKQTKWFKALCEGDAKAWATAWELANSKLRFQMRGWEGVTNGFIVLSTRAKNLSSPLPFQTLWELLGSGGVYSNTKWWEHSMILWSSVIILSSDLLRKFSTLLRRYCFVTSYKYIYPLFFLFNLQSPVKHKIKLVSKKE